MFDIQNISTQVLFCFHLKTKSTTERHGLLIEAYDKPKCITSAQKLKQMQQNMLLSKNSPYFIAF